MFIEFLWNVIMFVVFGALIFVVIGLFLGVRQHILRGILLISLGLILVRVLWGASTTVALLTLLIAVALSARLMFFRARYWR